MITSVQNKLNLHKRAHRELHLLPVPLAGGGVSVSSSCQPTADTRQVSEEEVRSARFAHEACLGRAENHRFSTWNAIRFQRRRRSAIVGGAAPVQLFASARPRLRRAPSCVCGELAEAEAEAHQRRLSQTVPSSKRRNEQSSSPQKLRNALEEDSGPDGNQYSHSPASAAGACASCRVG